MAAYLIVDVDDLLEHFRRRGIALDLQELAVGLRGGAALAAGLARAEQLKAVAAANWEAHPPQAYKGVDPRQVFKAAGYDIFVVPNRQNLADALAMHYFSYDPEPVNELILATTNPDLMPLIRRIKTTRSARIRMWGVEDVLKGTEFADEVIFQPLESLLGIQQTKNVAVYIDFENIAISLNDQGFTVNLDALIDSFQRQAQAHGQVVKMAAYAPWGNRGSLPPIVDHRGQEVADDAMGKLMKSSIDPVYNLPGKNSADMRIASDIISHSGYPDSADIYIVASGDRDFADVITALRARNKTVIVWGVRGATSSILTNNTNLHVEYVEDFTALQTHQSLSHSALATDDAEEVVGFMPSQWSSVIMQFDQTAVINGTETLTRKALVDRLVDVGAVVSRPRGEDLVSQAISFGILRALANTRLVLDTHHPVAERTQLIRDRVVVRVLNTLSVREWEYVNYGFLLKGLAMDRDLERPGMNYSDQWRSDWIDCMVREGVLVRELVPHRHNPDDLVPVIRLPDGFEAPKMDESSPTDTPIQENWGGITPDELERMEPETADMARRVVISVEQFTSFRGFTWCPLGSLHKRLRNYDRGMSFQRSVEYLMENGAASVSEYSNPQSEFFTKGISLHMHSEIVRMFLDERDTFVRLLLSLYEKNMTISDNTVKMLDPGTQWNTDLWFSVMETENILNPVPGRGGQYSLFRTHHTVTLVADAQKS